MWVITYQRQAPRNGGVCNLYTMCLVMICQPQRGLACREVGDSSFRGLQGLGYTNGGCNGLYPFAEMNRPVGPCKLCSPGSVEADNGAKSTKLTAKVLLPTAWLNDIVLQAGCKKGLDEGWLFAPIFWLKEISSFFQEGSYPFISMPTKSSKVSNRII